ncbi:amidase [Candidatus Albibeggiatoa sp. nov. NOAA]|uniref:amidase n=1 Tax=Candidatus Albibeggiatoa sp. nov. NOAA TaxID=3162724 RepID=UPI0032F2A47E|nr:amidase [Thiotrichaceae bacterium]
MSKFPEYSNYDALGLAELVRNGDVLSVDLLAEAKDRLDKINSRFNAVTYQSDTLSNALLDALNKESVFCGVPFLVKDLMLPFKDIPLSNGTKAMQSYIPSENSVMANQLNASGLITFGKTSTSELGTSSLTKTTAFGETLNPWDSSKNAGGSSGGSSVVVATRVVPMAYSSDGGGSIRLPASYCGIFGLKPSQGINQYEDMSKAWGGAVVSHVSTISVRDSAAYLDFVAGNISNNYSIKNPNQGSYLHSLYREDQKLKIGLITEAPTKTPVDPECIKAAEVAAKACESLGHHVISAKWNFDGRELMRAFLTVVMYYTHKDVNNIASLLGISEKQLDIELNTKFMSMAGSGISQEKLDQSLNIWKKATQKIAELYQQFDVILTPTVATPPLPSNALDPSSIEKLLMKVLVVTGLGKKAVNEKSLEMVIDKSLYSMPFTPIANITGQPAMSVPLHWDKNNLPHGTQFMANIGEERILFMLAHQLEQAYPWVDKIPNEMNF